MLLRKLLLAALAGAVVQASQAQTVIQPGAGVPIALQVQRLAPQLVPFAGSQANFDSLVNGLALGSPVTLTTVDANAVAQTVNFTLPGSTLGSPVEIARALESVRQQLIASGVATPSAQQLGFTLTGTAVPVTFNTTAVPSAGTGAPAAGVGGRPAAAGGTIPSPAEQIQSRRPAPRINTSDDRRLGNLSDSPIPATPTTLGAPPPAPPALEAPPPAVQTAPAGGTIARDR